MIVKHCPFKKHYLYTSKHKGLAETYSEPHWILKTKSLTSGFWYLLWGCINHFFAKTVICGGLAAQLLHRNYPMH